MRIGINFSNTTMLGSVEPVLDSARQCDADGFAHWWLPQAGYLDALTVFAAAASLAPRIEMGTAVIPTWLYPPHTLAAKAHTTASLIGSRLTLGVGLSYQAVVEKRLRMVWNRPILHAVERAGRPQPRIVASLIVTVTDDEAAVRARHAANLAGYGSLPSYRSMLEREGADTPADVCLIGNEDSVLEQMDNLASAGASDFAAVEVGTNPEERQRTAPC